MPKINFIKEGKSTIEVNSGTVLMQALLANNIPVASSCDGDGVCAKCKIQIIEGIDNLSIPNETEVFLKEKNNLAKDIRISCQTKVMGDITIDTGYW